MNPLFSMDYSPYHSQSTNPTMPKVSTDSDGSKSQNSRDHPLQVLWNAYYA